MDVYLEVAEVAGVQGRIVTTHLSQSVDKILDHFGDCQNKSQKKQRPSSFCVCFLKDDANKKGVVGEPRDSVQQELG